MKFLTLVIARSWRKLSASASASTSVGTPATGPGVWRNATDSAEPWDVLLKRKRSEEVKKTECKVPSYIIMINYHVGVSDFLLWSISVGVWHSVVIWEQLLQSSERSVGLCFFLIWASPFEFLPINLHLRHSKEITHVSLCFVKQSATITFYEGGSTYLILPIRDV